MKKYEFRLEGLDCANCANKIQNKFSENKSYENVVVNFNTLKLSFETEIEVLDEEIEKIVKSLEPEVEVINLKKHNKKENFNHEHYDKHNHINTHAHKDKHSSCNEECYENNKTHEHSEKNIHNENHRNKENIHKKKNINLLRVLLGIILMIISMKFNLSENISLVLIIISYVILLYRTSKNAIKLLKKKTIDENFLVTISCIGALLIGEEIEGLMVIVLYEIGKILEEKAINNTRKSIADLMDIKPEYANLKHGNHEHKVNPEDVNIGDIIVIKQGEKVPLDGRIISGVAYLNTASLTGESTLREVKENDMVLSGCINEKGLIEVKVTEKYEDSTVNRILELVENATDKKAKTETFVNKASKIYTPIVLIMALLVIALMPAILNITYKASLYRALIFLVVSCPCAIVISVPLSYFSGIGKASKQGILVKGSNYLDAIKDIKYIAFDKTGTLTKGKFEVEKIKVYDKDYSENEILKFAAIGESFSNHPLATAVLNRYGKIVNTDRATDFEEIAGKGLQYRLDGRTIKIGNAELTGNKDENEVGTIIYVKVDENVIGALILNDSIKCEAKEAIEELKYLGVNTYMFTGDNLEIAKKVAKEIGISEIKAEMLPIDKYNELEKIINNKTSGKVAFVGDGINDSPVLALADIGISMGGIGSSSAIEASDMVIMTDNLNKIEEAIKISKFTNKIIKQNLIFALLVKVGVLLLSVLGLAQMWMAVFADVGVTLITIFNTIRILKK
ncbi:MAG: cadmium-translocating P-type ATPase [Clostridia bacterium]|nr:cadmium-translocating P-type ATPase [Clostridia bacterium]